MLSTLSFSGLQKKTTSPPVQQPSYNPSPEGVSGVPSQPVLSPQPPDTHPCYGDPATAQTCRSEAIQQSYV